MRIGFYGHSNCAYIGTGSFLNIVAEALKAEIVNRGVRQGSEERILFELKKTKDLDLAIIFHSRPNFIFLPNCDRDLDMIHVSNNRLEYLINQSDWNSDFYKEHHPAFQQEFITLDNFMNAAVMFKNHFYDPDLLLNRFQGSLMCINKYLTDKNIKSIHVLEEKNSIPSWFNFSTGIVDYEIMKLVSINKIETGKFFFNLVTPEGNKKIATKLLEMIEELD